MLLATQSQEILVLRTRQPRHYKTPPALKIAGFAVLLMSLVGAASITGL
jgi:hypothetical protein